MANTKISQLPTWSGTAADLRWFVMNNSGENETYKFSGYTAPYRWNSSNSGITEVNTTKSSIFNARGLTNTETANSFSNFVVGKGNTTGSIGMFMFVFGDDNTTTAGGGLGTADAIVNFGRANQITGPVTHTSFVFGRGCIASAPRTFIFGEDTQTNSTDSIAMGRQNYGNGNEATSIGGSYNRITTSSQSGIFGGTNNTISSTSPYNSIFGGYNNTIGSSRTYATMLGCSGRTASADNTTFVENLHTYRTPSTQVQPISSGTTFTCNLDNGAKSQFYITGTSTINITNVRDGASFMIKTQTDGNYNMTWTATGGYTFVFEGGIKDPGNNVIDIFKFEVFGNVIYGSRAHNFS